MASLYHPNCIPLLLIVATVAWRTFLDISALPDTGRSGTRAEDPVWMLQNPNTIRLYGTKKPKPKQDIDRGEIMCFVGTAYGN